jgi:hypothetical protein
LDLTVVVILLSVMASPMVSPVILGGGIVDVILQSLGVASDVLDAASLIGNIAVCGRWHR